MLYRPTVDHEERLARLTKPVDPQAVGGRVDHSSEAGLQLGQLDFCDDALEHGLLHALTESFADLRHGAQPSTSCQAFRCHVVRDEDLHPDHRARNAG